MIKNFFAHGGRALAAGPQTAESIQLWLVDQLATYLEVAPQEVDIDEPLVNYGLDSLETVRLSGELEKLLGRKLVPTLLWDYPTIRTVVREGLQLAQD